MNPCKRKCHNCSNVADHEDSITPHVRCKLCGSQDTRLVKEAVNHPPHYGGDTTYEAIKVIEAWELDFHLGNTVKYISRAGKKGDVKQDLEKAMWYLKRKLQSLEKP